MKYILGLIVIGLCITSVFIMKEVSLAKEKKLKLEQEAELRRTEEKEEKRIAAVQRATVEQRALNQELEKQAALLQDIEERRNRLAEK